jgi:hypothetical protein
LGCHSAHVHFTRAALSTRGAQKQIPITWRFTSKDDFGGMYPGDPMHGDAGQAGDFDDERFVDIVGLNGGIQLGRVLTQDRHLRRAHKADHIALVYDEPLHLITGGKAICAPTDHEQVKGPGGVGRQDDAFGGAVQEQFGWRKGVKL